MNVNENKQNKELLKQYLNQYYLCKVKKLQLEKRLKNIQEEMTTPIGGKGYAPINHKGNDVGLGAASFVYRMSEIETRIEEQKVKVADALLRVMDVMDFLEENSPERMVLEFRFIDCKSWNIIEKEMHFSRSMLFLYQNKALEKLLTFKKVNTIVERYKVNIF